MPRTPPRLRPAPSDANEHPASPHNATHVPPHLASVHQSTTPLRKENQGRLNLRAKAMKTSPVVKAKAIPKPPPALSDRMPRASNIRHARKTSPDGNSRRRNPMESKSLKTPAAERRQSFDSVDIESLGPDSGFSADISQQPRMASVRQALAMLQETTQQQMTDQITTKAPREHPADLVTVKSSGSNQSQFSFSDLQKIKELIASSPRENAQRRPRRQNSEPPPNAKKRSFSAHSNCLISFTPDQTPPQPQDKDEIDGSNHMITDVFRDGRPPKRRRPSLSSSTAHLDYRDKMDFDSEDLKCFENLPPEKRSRLLFVCKLKPLLCPDSTMVDYLARVDLRKVSRLMSLHPAFTILTSPSQAEEVRAAVHEHKGSPASFGGPSPVAAASVGAAMSLPPPVTCVASPDCKPFTPVPFRAASPPLIHLDCPTNLTGFRAEATPKTFSRLLDGYEMTAARERVTSTSLNLRPGPFDFLGVVRSQIHDLLSVSPPPVIDVCGSLCTYNELHLCKPIHLQLGYAAVCLLFKSFDQWLLEGFKNSRLITSDIKRSQLMQVHSADRFVRRCFLMRIAVDLQDEWRRLEIHNLRKWNRANWCNLSAQPFTQTLVTPSRVCKLLTDKQALQSIYKQSNMRHDSNNQRDTNITDLLMQNITLKNQIHYVKERREILRRLDDQELMQMSIQPYIKLEDDDAEVKTKDQTNILTNIDTFIDNCEVKLAQTFASRLKEAVNRRERFKNALEMRLASFAKLPSPPDRIASDGYLHLRQSVSDYFAPSVIQLLGGLRKVIKIGPGNDIAKPPGPLPTMRSSLSGQESVGRSSLGRSSFGTTPPDLQIDLSELHRLPLTPLPSRVSEEVLTIDRLTPQRSR